MANTFIITFTDEETQEQQSGVLLNTAYCPVRDRWMLLVSCTDDDKLKSIPHDGYDTKSMWIADDFEMSIDNRNRRSDDNEDDYDDEDEDEGG